MHARSQVNLRLNPGLGAPSRTSSGPISRFRNGCFSPLPEANGALRPNEEDLNLVEDKVMRNEENHKCPNREDIRLGRMIIGPEDLVGPNPDGRLCAGVLISGGRIKKPCFEEAGTNHKREDVKIGNPYLKVDAMPGYSTPGIVFKGHPVEESHQNNSEHSEVINPNLKPEALPRICDPSTVLNAFRGQRRPHATPRGSPRDLEGCGPGDPPTTP